MSRRYHPSQSVDYLREWDDYPHMTLRLHESDPYLREFTAEVQKVEGDWVVLDRTAFYPGGGGQERDQGTIEGLTVSGVRGKDEIGHQVPGHQFMVGQKVCGRIDWENRYGLMRAHTGEHLLFSALCRRTEMELVKISLSREKKVLVVKGNVTWEMMKEAVLEVNSIIAGGAQVNCQLVDRDSLGEGGPRVKLDRIADRQVRVVSIGEYDQAACAGVHLQNANEIGMLLVSKFTSAKPAGDWEIEFLVGPSAVQRAVELSVRSLELAERMGALPQDSLTAFDNRERELLRCREALKHFGRQALTNLEPREMMGLKIYSGTFSGLDRKLLMEKATELVVKGGSVAAFVAQDDKTFLVLACSVDVKTDCVSVLNQVLAPYGGRGGGKPNFASGGTPGELDGATLLDAVMSLLETCK